MFTPSEYTPVRDKSEIRWFVNGETGDEEVLNRPIDDLANMVTTVVNESMTSKKSVRLSNEANIQYSEKTAQTLKGYSGSGTFLATINNTSTIVTVSTTQHLLTGATITGQGIPDSTTIVEITSNTEFVISNAATESLIDVTLSFTQTLSLLYIDSVRPNNNDRILLKDQTNAAENGLYVVTDKGSDIAQWILTRSDDGNLWNQYASAIVAVDEGSTNADTVWFCTVNKDAGVIGTDSITFQGLGGSGQMLGTARTRVFSYNAQIVSENIIVPANYNSSAIGPITIDDGYTLTIEDGARVVIL